MLEALGSGYLILAEFPVKWVPSAAQIPADPPELTMYPVWMMDGAGTRAAIFLRCPACLKIMGLAPGNAKEQEQWNSAEVEVSTMAACEKCKATYMITTNKAFLLSLLPPQKVVGCPRPWTGLAAGH